MSELPTILVTNGWKTDRNRKLTEVVIPSTVKTLNAPTKVTFMGKTLNVVPSTTAALQEFEAPYCTTIAISAAFSNYTHLVRASFPKLISAIGQTQANFFASCTALTTIDLESFVSYQDYGAGTFISNSQITSLNLPSFKTCSTTGYGGTFIKNCASLKTAVLPVLELATANQSNGGTFYQCQALESVQLGSEGHPVTTLGAYTFNGCTQSGLMITIYTTGGASLSGSPWGATNATIVYESA